MNYKEILKIVNGVLVNIPKKNIKIKHFQIDSRQIEEGDCFIAIHGINQDGHQFIEDAINHKASCIIIEKEIPLSGNIAIIKVSDTKQALLLLGQYYREKYRRIPLIAVTGSVGKTTTKELISNILETQYRVLKSKGNHNNHIGVPLTLFELNKRYDVAVLEMGMNHLKEIDKLSKTCIPDIGVITNIGTAHIGNLGSRKNIFKAKMEITNGMEDGILILNGDDTYLKKVKPKSHYNVISCGFHHNNQLRATHIEKTEHGMQFIVKVHNKKYQVMVPINHYGYVHNVLLAIKVGLLFRVDMETILEVVANYHGEEQRMNKIPLSYNNVLIDDCYNASYESIKESLQSLPPTKQHKVIILGDVLELGDYSYCIHKKIEKQLKKVKNAEILLVGNETKIIEGKNIVHFINNEQIIEYISKQNYQNTYILIKGSRKMKLEEIRDYFLEKEKEVK